MHDKVKISNFKRDITFNQLFHKSAISNKNSISELENI